MLRQKKSDLVFLPARNTEQLVRVRFDVVVVIVVVAPSHGRE